MSSTPDDSTAALIESAKITEYVNYFWVAAGALMCYEYIITFDREIHLMWRKGTRLRALLFFVNRYMALINAVLNVAITFAIPTTVASCSALDRLISATSLFGYLVSAVFSSLRVYAMSGSQWKVAALTFVLLLVPVGTNIYNYAVTDFIAQPPPTYCQAVPNMTPKTEEALVIVTRGAMLVGDVLVIIVTWMKTYRTVRLTADVGIRVSFSRLLFRDGAIYFIVMSFLNAFQIVVTFVEQITYMSVLADPIMAILISRFILNLREANFGAPGALESDPGASFRATVDFARHVHPLGAPLDCTPFERVAAGAHTDDGESESGGSVDADTDADADTDMVSDVEGV